MNFFERLYSNNYKDLEDKITNIFIALLELLPHGMKEQLFKEIIGKIPIKDPNFERMSYNLQKKVYFDRFIFSPNQPDAMIKIPSKDNAEIFYILIENKMGTNYHIHQGNIDELRNYDEAIKLNENENIIFLGISERENFPDNDLEIIRSQLRFNFIHISWSDIFRKLFDIFPDDGETLVYRFLINKFNEFYINRGVTMLDLPENFSQTINNIHQLSIQENRLIVDKKIFLDRFEKIVNNLKNKYEIRMNDYNAIINFINENKEELGYTTYAWVKSVEDNNLVKARFEVNIDNISLIIQYNLGEQRFNLYLIFKDYAEEIIQQVSDQLRENGYQTNSTRYGAFSELGYQFPEQPDWNDEEDILNKLRGYVDQLLNWFQILLPYIRH